MGLIGIEGWGGGACEGGFCCAIFLFKEVLVPWWELLSWSQETSSPVGVLASNGPATLWGSPDCS